MISTKSTTFAVLNGFIRRGHKVPSLFVHSSMNLKEVILGIATEYLKDDSYFLVDVVVKGINGKTKILVLLDGDDGINIDDCASLSRQISARLELEDIMDIAYVLEVSSPGLDHPLMLERQYKKNVGRQLKLVTKEGASMKGKLTGISGETLEFDKEVKEKKKVNFEHIQIPISDIEKANVLVSFK